MKEKVINLLSKFFKKEKIIIVLIIVLGFSLRIYLTKYGNFGDVAVFAELGEKFWKVSLKEFYFRRDYFYTHPAYPPLAYYFISLSYLIYDKRYILAEIHNKAKIIPADFIIYFSKPVANDPLLYGEGYYLLLKLIPILSDFGISFLIYKIVFLISRDKRKATFSFLFYFFNPLSIFLSSFWGQNDPLVVFLGLTSFYLLFENKISASVLTLFTSFLIKPMFIIFLPVYLWCLFKKRLNFSSLFWGLAFCFIIFFFSTFPFSGNDIFGFTKRIFFENILPSSKGVAKASVSAFNFYSIFFTIDKTLALSKIGFLKLEHFGIFSFLLLNIFAFLKFLYKTNFKSILNSLFFIGMGSFLFLTNMLERYFFPTFPFLVILSFINRNFWRYALIINIILFLNLIWAFYRRSVGFIDHTFTDYNFFLIRFFSLLNVSLFILSVGKFAKDFQWNYIKKKRVVKSKMWER